ncbi:hypothetical protein ACWEOE_12305 [Amycolatopsis sp. NPDC004368]
MSFFTDGPRERPLFPVREQELFGYEGRPWMGPPSDHIVPALLPWARPLGRSERTIVALRGVEVWPEALTLRLAVYSRDSLQEGRGGSLIDHRRIPDYNALLVGVLYPDGSRASSESISVPSASEPASPVLRAVGGGGTQFHLDHQIFVWPLPGDGPFTLVIQWLDRDIEETHTELDGAAVRAAALAAGELWPGLPRRPGNGVTLRRATSAFVGQGSSSSAAPAAGGAVESGVPAAELPVRSSSPLPHRDPAGGSAVEDSPPAEAAGGPPRSPSVLLPRLAGEGALLPRRNVPVGPEAPRSGQASPLPRRKAAERAGAPTIAQATGKVAEPLSPPAQARQLPPRTGDDSPTVAMATPAAEPLPQPSRPTPVDSADETRPVGKPGEPVPLPQPLPQPSRMAKVAEPKPPKGRGARRWRDPGE